MRGRVLKYCLLRECPLTEARFHHIISHVGTFKHQQCMSCLWCNKHSWHTWNFVLPCFVNLRMRKPEAGFFVLCFGNLELHPVWKYRLCTSGLVFLSDQVSLSFHGTRCNAKFIPWDSTGRKRMRKQRLGAEPQNLYLIGQWANWDTCARKGPSPRKMHLMVPKGVTFPARCRVCIGLFGRIMVK